MMGFELMIVLEVSRGLEMTDFNC